MRLTRRDILAGLGATAALPAGAGAPVRTPRPPARGEGVAAQPVDAGGELVARSGLTGAVAYAVADAATGEILEARQPGLALPPASTVKTLTTLYALERLGPAHRFQTRLLAGGPVRNGRIHGDLILAGGGDPVLDTRDLMEMAAALKERGIREVGGKLKVWIGALPRIYEIDGEQPDHVGYNPSICGLNLNFNRVHFGWTRQGSDYRVSMDARSGRYIPGVEVARMRVVDRKGPVYTYEQAENRDDWTVARFALGQEGARWLPVRHPGLYAGEVFQVLARSQGIMSRGAVEIADAAEGEELVSRRSAALEPILEGMLTHSTNLTAEVAGLGAALAEGPPVGTLAASAGRMSDWLAARHGLEATRLEDHSGLGDDSVVTARDMVRAMLASQETGRLRPLLKPFRVEDRRFEVAAKTGTLNFVSALTGFVTGPKDRPLAFAILTGDIPRRDALSVAERERPAGGRRWIGASRWLQRALLERWGALYTV